MSTVVFVRRFLTDYARNPVNILLLALVPFIFVVVVAGSLADAAKLLGGTPPAVETATAGWAAAFLAGIAMYLQTAATREVDRRLVYAGLRPARIVIARLLTGLALSALASAAALVALAVRTGYDHPGRVIGGTLMFSIIYVAVGGAVGAVAPNPINGTVIVLFVWILDVFFGPALGAADRVATRALPTHFVTLWMVDIPSGHSGRMTDLGWALMWAATAVIASSWLSIARTRTAHSHRLHPRRLATEQTHAAMKAAWRQARRNHVQWILFIIVPVVFILTASLVTPDKPINITVREDGQSILRSFAMPAVHGATMAPIAVASLAALIGLFAMVDNAEGDRRVALAGLKTNALLGARLSILTVTALSATAVSLTATALVFQAARWPVYAAANVLIAFTYGLIGCLLAPIFGRVGGVFIAFLLPFLDLAIVQSPMLHSTPTTLARILPGYGGSRVLLDGALTNRFDEGRPLLIGVAWLLALTAAVALTYRNRIRRSQFTEPPGEPGRLLSDYQL